MSCRACKDMPQFPDGCPLCPTLDGDAGAATLTIACDFYAFLGEELGDGAVEPGTWGRGIHNHIAELEEAHATLKAKYAVLQREHAKVKGEHAVMVREFAPERVGDMVVREAERELEKTSAPVSLDDIKLEYEESR